MQKIMIGVMGPGAQATARDLQNAEQLGQQIAQEGWVLLTGGRNEGVMDAASQGAQAVGGLTIGILPSSDRTHLSPFVDIPILTGMGSARNNINVLSSDVVIACGMGLGTAAEVALALKAGKAVILLNQDPLSWDFFRQYAPDRLFWVEEPQAAIALTKTLLNPFPLSLEDPIP